MERVPTVPTLEKGLRAPLRPVLEAAVRAGLRRVAWVDSHYVQSCFFCLVYHKLPPLCKAPGMQPSLPCASPGSHTAANSSQVFMDYYAPWRYRLHKTFRIERVSALRKRCCKRVCLLWHRMELQAHGTLHDVECAI